MLKKQSALFSSLISYHPLLSTHTMYTLEVHYKQIQFKGLQDRLHTIQTQLREKCTAVGCTPPSDLCTCQDNSSPNAGVVSSLSAPYKPVSIYDYQPWQYFDSSALYPDQEIYPNYKLKMRKDFRQELKVVLPKAVQKTSERYGHQLKFHKLVNGWVRHNPFVGSEYIIDYELLDGAKKVVSKRVHLVRPLASNYITLKDNGDPTATISMVVPITRVNQRFREFMAMYEGLVLSSGEHVQLVLSVYGEEDIRFVKSVIKDYENRYPQARINVLEGRGGFSRGKALHHAFSSLQPNQLVFVCDVDMRVTRPFLERCRRNTIQGSRVYYPEFFKLYNLNYVYRESSRPRTLTIKREHGHWAYYSFGMLCIYKSDYDAVGGMDTNIKGWGDEDVEFFQKALKRHLDVLRAPDPGLSHHWHEKVCPRTLSKLQYRHCLSSLAENLADRKELASYIYERGMEIKSGRTELGNLTTAPQPPAVEEDNSEEQDYHF